MLILSIETSCDDTSVALVEIEQKRGETMPHFKVLKSIVSSQTDIHRHWGGVVPTLAKREHEKNLPKLWEIIKKALVPELVEGQPKANKLKAKSYKLDLIAVTAGPGLEPALWAGIEFAKKLSKELKIPLVGANHLEGHLYSNLLSPTPTLPLYQGGGSGGVFPPSSVEGGGAGGGFPTFPAIVLLVSGGHTILVHMKSLRSWRVLGETRDDAVGEAFDKVARLMGLPYPGGPEIEKLALKGNPQAIKFPRPMIHEKNYDFSFSGLKTAVLYYLKEKSPTSIPPLSSKEGGSPKDFPPPQGGGGVGGGSVLAADVAASFQAAAVDVLATKTKKAALEFGAQSIFLCGGVAANKALRQALQKMSGDIGAQFFAPASEYNTDNAAMIAGAAYMRLKSRKKKYPLEADSSLGL